MTTTRTTRTMALALLLTLLTALLAMGAAAPAQAETYYRYWTEWVGTNGTWNFATVSPDASIPADGAVSGWRFEIAGESGSARTPRIAPDFAAICGSTAAVAGSKRVALVIDYGVPADAPEGSTPPEPEVGCTVTPVNSNSLQVLATAGSQRLDKTLLCAIDGYPATGCGDVVPGATPPPTSEPTLPVPVAAASASATSTTDTTSTSFPIVPLVIALIVLVLALLAFRMSRKSRG
ncbi:MAG: hypothetical protein F2842_08135 [Actinobacteria bacterium]|uniref:Unannotated protein n=1 Tax=freshwater metagenome TaxID=449393 RepID=A0A6J7KEZ6_9ZZZZ|nr:hypothetical protein [Actinomycetota bacterium]